MDVYIYTRMITPHWTWPFRQVAAVASASHPAVWAAAGSVRSVAGCGGFWRGHTSMIWDTNRYKYRYIVAFHNKTLWPYDDLMMTLWWPYVFLRLDTFVSYFRKGHLGPHTNRGHASADFDELVVIFPQRSRRASIVSCVTSEQVAC